MTWMKAELVLTWFSVILFFLSVIAYAFGFFFKKDRGNKIALFLTIAGFLLHSAALGLRWYMVGHGPYTTQFEVYSSNSWVIIALFLFTVVKIRKLLPAGLLVIPLTLVFLFLALLKYDGLPGHSTSFHIFWLTIHIFSIKLAIAAIFIALGCSIRLLYKTKGDDSSEYPNLELYNYRFTGLGFVFWTLATATGAVWANLRWGRYWAWDPIETWSLIVWLGLGLGLHLQRFFYWRGRKAAILTVISVCLFVLVLFIIPVLSRGLHSMYVIGGTKN